MNFGAVDSALGFCGSRVEVGDEVLEVAAFIRCVSMVFALLMSSALPRLKGRPMVEQVMREM
jgi:hypothetical protein